MNRLPDFEHALIPENRLRYCLDPTHVHGQHKARVFRSALGLDAGDSKILEAILRDGIRRHEAALRFEAPDGTQRWVVEWVVLGRLTPLRFVSAWNCNPGRSAPILVSCYLKKVKR